MQEFRNTGSRAKVIAYAEEKGVRTGSYHFGYEHADDIDYVVCAREFNSFCAGLGECVGAEEYIENGNFQFMSIKIKAPELDRIVNIILVKNEYEMEVWAKATEAVVKVIEDPVLKKVYAQKSKRLGLFSSLLYGQLDRENPTQSLLDKLQQPEVEL